MKKVGHIALKVLFSLFLLLMVVGALNVMPAPTRDLYNTDLAFDFIKTLMSVGYINIIMGIVSALALISLWIKREALAGVLMLPISVNVFAFHAFIDGGIFTAGAIMANTFFLFNLYIIFKYRSAYKDLFAKRS